MQSTFGGVEIAKRGIIAHSQLLRTSGHNISNINTPGYSRQRVTLASTRPIYIAGATRAETPGQIGQGVDIQSISRQKDMQIEEQIISQSHKKGYWETRSKYLAKLEDIQNEVGDSSLRSAFDRYWQSWEELSLYPEEMSVRIQLVERADTLVSMIRERADQLEQIQNILRTEIDYSVSKVNELAQEIAKINTAIQQAKAVGDSPNDLMDRRDLLLGELGTLINITVSNQDSDELMVHTNGKILVQGKFARSFQYQKDAENNTTEFYVYWQDTGERIDRSGGSLSSLLVMRDQDLRGEQQNLNTFAITLIHNTNELHRQGISLTNESGLGFFTEEPVVLNAQGNYDSDLNGIFDQSRIYGIAGIHTLELNQQVGFGGILTLPGREAANTVEVEYYGTDTVQDIINKINNSGAEVAASLNSQNQLSIQASASNDSTNPDFVIRTLQDSGQFLVGYSGILTETGPAGAYNWQQENAVAILQGTNYTVSPFLHPASSLRVNPGIINDPRRIAAALPNVNNELHSGNNQIALKIANLRIRKLGLANVESFDNFFSHTIASIGARGQEAEVLSQTQEHIISTLRSRQSEISGVDLDKELQEMIKYQTAYQGVAKFLSNLESLYDILMAI